MHEKTARKPSAHTELRRKGTDAAPDHENRKPEKGQSAPMPRPDPEEDDLFNDLPV